MRDKLHRKNPDFLYNNNFHGPMHALKKIRNRALLPYLYKQRNPSPICINVHVDGVQWCVNMKDLHHTYTHTHIHTHTYTHTHTHTYIYLYLYLPIA